MSVKSPVTTEVSHKWAGQQWCVSSYCARGREHSVPSSARAPAFPLLQHTRTGPSHSFKTTSSLTQSPYRVNTTTWPRCAVHSWTFVSRGAGEQQQPQKRLLFWGNVYCSAERRSRGPAAGWAFFLTCFFFPGKIGGSATKKVEVEFQSGRKGGHKFLRLRLLCANRNFVCYSPCNRLCFFFISREQRTL